MRPRHQAVLVLFWLIPSILLAGLTGSAASPVKAGPAGVARAAQPAGAAPLILPGSDIRFTQYSADQGLSMSVVDSIAQDQQGFLWFATQDGLNRYDGRTFKILKHDPDNPNSLSANWVQVLYVDSTGVLYAGTDGGGLDRYNPISGAFTHFRSNSKDPKAISSDTVYALYEDRSGTLWVGTSMGVDRLNRRSGQFTHLRDDPDAPESLKNGLVSSVYQDINGDIWFGAHTGLVRFDPPTHTYQTFRHDPQNPDSLGSDVVTVIQEDRFGDLWVGTSGGGLSLLQDGGRKFKRYPLPGDPEDDASVGSHMIKCISEDPSGRLWIGTWGGGLHYFDPQTGKSIQFLNEPGNPNSLSSNNVIDIFLDRSGSVWIGTFGGGLSKFDVSSLNFTHYRKRLGDENSLISDIVWAVYADTDLAWIGTEGGLDRLDRQTGQYAHYTHDPSDPHSLSGNNVISIYKDHLGSLWVGTNGNGLNLFDPHTGGFRHFRKAVDGPKSLSDDKISVMIEDNDGNLWVGTRNGLDKFNRQSETFTAYYSDPYDSATLPDDSISTLILGKDGTFWVGTFTGLSQFDPRTGTARRYSIKPKDEEGSDQINVLSLVEDPQGMLWIGTVGRGLIRFDPATGEAIAYHEKDGLPNDTAYGVLSDDKGDLWFSTNNGLVRFDPIVRTFEVFGAKDGLQANEFNSNAFFKSASGEMFFGGIRGLSAFMPDNIQHNRYAPPVVLVALDSNGQPYPSGAPIENLDQVALRYPDNSFEFEFAGLSYVQPEQNQYAYKLENFDHDWNYTGTKNFGRYTNLPGGAYTLRLKASNNVGVWTETERLIRIQVIPPFWQTLWFRICLALVGLLAVFAGYRLRVRSVLNRSRELESIVQERTGEIERRRQELEALYSADEALYRNLQLDQVLQTLVEYAVNLLNADKGLLLVLDKEKKLLIPRLAYGFKTDILDHVSFRVGEGIAGLVAESGEPVLVPDVEQDPRVNRQVVDLEGICSFMQVPLKVAGDVFGVFSADYVQPHSFGNDELRLLASLAQRAAQAIQNAQLYEQTQEQAVAEERNRLARELHDAVTQTLFSASLIAEALPTAFENDPQEGQDLLAGLRQLNRGALAEMRALLMELRPSALAEANLEDLLRQLGDAAAGREGIPVIVQTNGHCDLPPDVHIALYRIAQEALNNALKHARAGQITIKLANYPPEMADASPGTPAGVQLVVQDDGRGFDQEKTSSEHLGLHIMRERAQAIGARLSLHSQKGKGTQVIVLWENSHYN